MFQGGISPLGARGEVGTEQYPVRFPLCAGLSCFPLKSQQNSNSSKTVQICFLLGVLCPTPPTPHQVGLEADLVLGIPGTGLPKFELLYFTKLNIAWKCF